MNGENKDLGRAQDPYRALWSKLFVTTEGRVFALGIGITLLGLILMGVVALWSVPTSRIIGTMAFANIVFGRAVSMSIGYAAGYGHWLVITVNMVTETILVLLFYPLFVFSLKKLVVFPALKTVLDRTHEAATTHEAKVRRYGIVGLFVFVWFPFWMTGPVVGSAIGYLLRLPALLTLTVVLAGTYIAMGAWAWFLFRLQQHAAGLGPLAPVLIVILFVAIVIAGYFLNNHRKNKKNEIINNDSSKGEN